MTRKYIGAVVVLLFAIATWAALRSVPAYTRESNKVVRVTFSQSEMELLVAVRQAGLQQDPTQLDKVT
jgi:hypothetical protein